MPSRPLLQPEAAASVSRAQFFTPIGVAGSAACPPHTSDQPSLKLLQQQQQQGSTSANVPSPDAWAPCLASVEEEAMGVESLTTACEHSTPNCSDSVIFGAGQFSSKSESAPGLDSKSTWSRQNAARTNTRCLRSSTSAKSLNTHSNSHQTIEDAAEVELLVA